MQLKALSFKIADRWDRRIFRQLIGVTRYSVSNGRPVAWISNALKGYRSSMAPNVK